MSEIRYIEDQPVVDKFEAGRLLGRAEAFVVERGLEPVGKLKAGRAWRNAYSLADVCDLGGIDLDATLEEGEICDDDDVLAQVRFPVEEMRQLIEQRGGLSLVLERIGIATHEYDEETGESTPTVEYERHERRLRLDTLGIKVVDEMCCDLLRVHPGDLYGDRYWNPERYVESAEAVA